MSDHDDSPQLSPEAAVLGSILKSLEAIAAMANRIEAIAARNPPDWQMPLAAYKFPWWQRIGAKVLDADGHGPTSVSWCGHIYVRRTGDNPKYGAAIWFSRGSGQEPDGGVAYVKLITFKDGTAATPLPEYVVRALSQSSSHGTKKATNPAQGG